MIRGLVRQQEDATRQLGEELRNEAKEHVSLLAGTDVYSSSQRSRRHFCRGSLTRLAFRN